MPPHLLTTFFLHLLLHILPLTTPLSTPISSSSSSTSTWSPRISSLADRRKLLRNQHHSSELISSKSFHHVEFYCGDAKSTAHHFSLALGMPFVGSTGQHTGNDRCVSYGLRSGDVRFLFTAPYSRRVPREDDTAVVVAVDEYEAPYALPSFDIAAAHDFFARHGLGVKALGLEVDDVTLAYEAAVANGAEGVCPPVNVPSSRSVMERCGSSSSDETEEEEEEEDAFSMAEVKLYGDVVLRFISDRRSSSDDNSTPDDLPFLPHLAIPSTSPRRRQTFGLQRIDHAVGNVDDLLKYQTRIAKFTGFHEFAEFTSEDVGTVESGLNSVVLASDSEHVLLPLNEPTNGRRKSQIQTFLEQNEGPGLQHLALKTDDIFETITQMRRVEEELGMGFELMKRPSDEYYRELPERLGDQLTDDQYMKLEQLGILADADDEGILLQLFTKPIGDRPTFFIEIIQRMGCYIDTDDGDINNDEGEKQLQRPGCGGFGQGNFRELFKAIEDHEKTLKV